MSFNDETSARDFIIFVAEKIGKKASDLEKIINIFEENWIENVGAIKQLDDDQWKELKIPMGLVNQIKKQFVEQEQPQKVAQPQSQSVQIDSSIKPHVMQTKSMGQPPVQKERVPEQIDHSGLFKQYLQQNKIEVYDAGQKDVHKDSVKTMFKVIDNLLQNPNEGKFRSLPKTNKAIQNKILAFKWIVKFLELTSFNFKANDTTAELENYNLAILNKALDSINEHVVSLGGQVAVTLAFDPTKGSVSTTTGESRMPPGLSSKEADKYDPSKVQEMINQIKKQRQSELEGKLDDRSLQIIHAQGSGQSIKQMLQDIDQKEIERMKELKMTADKMEVSQGNTAAMKFLAENEKNSKFQNKRSGELTKLLKTPHHTRASIRVKFPDGYILQGTFGALEKVKDVVEFVKSNLMHPTRKFYVFESPPRRVLNEKLFEQNLIQAKLVPSSLLYFAWTDLPETKNEHGPFMDMKRLREFIYTPPQKSLKEENKKDNDGDEIMS